MEQNLTLVGDSQVSSQTFLPVMNIAVALERRKILLSYIDQIMIEGEDYGLIPGTGAKGRKTLLKPGAEKLCNLFGLEPRISAKEQTLDWTGNDHGGEPFFYFLYRFSLYRDGRCLGEGEGSCNSWEKKYRYRNSERTCPSCGAAALLKSRNAGEGFFCWNKKGGCGAKFSERDPAIADQQVGQVANPDPADVVNTLQKMSQKRGLVCAVLIATGTSDIFTQDHADPEDATTTATTTTATTATVKKDPPKPAAPTATAQSTPAKKDPEPIKTQPVTTTTAPPVNDRVKAMHVAFRQLEDFLGVGNFSKLIKASGYERIEDIKDVDAGLQLHGQLKKFSRGVEECRRMIGLLDKDTAGQIAYAQGLIDPAEAEDMKDLGELQIALKAALDSKAVGAVA